MSAPTTREMCVAAGHPIAGTDDGRWGPDTEDRCYCGEVSRLNERGQVAKARHDATRLPVALVDVLVEHAPHRGGYGDFVVACDCGERGFARDADGNLRKDGESERAWAEHVAEAMTRAADNPYTVGEAFEELPVGPEACPDCKANKHPNCDGTSWDNALDGPVRCPCAVNEHQS